MYLGLDLGTSNSAVVGKDGGNLKLFKTGDGSDVLPSVIYLDRRGHRFVGKAAQDRILSAPSNIASGFKRLMGTSSPIRIGHAEWTPVECSAEIIKSLVGQAVSEAGTSDIKGAVITIPAAFNQMQSEATIEAARQAGLERVTLLQEPVAAALASIAHNREKNGVFLVYDLGGGTFDLALVLSTAGAINVVAHEGINMLGGRDFDRIIFDSVVRPWLLNNFNLPADFQSDEKFRHLATVCRYAIEKAKIQLSASTSASIFASEDEIRVADLDGQEIYISIDLSRHEMVELLKDRIDDSIALCRKIISQNGYKNEDISRIVPIGGPSKMPVIREVLQSELAIEVEHGLDPMTAVATGAAIFAESREWDGEKSTRKPAQSRENLEGAISLTLDYKSRVSDKTAKVRVKPVAQDPNGFEVEIFDEEGGSTGKIPINGPLSINVNVRKHGKNKYKFVVYDPNGRIVDEISREILIERSEASAASIPMTYTLAVKTQTGMVGYERNKLEPILKKGAPLPAQGEHRFRAGKTLIGGEEDFIAFEFYEMAEGIDNPEHNLHIGNFRLDSFEELERGERINRGDDLVIYWKMSDNGALSFSVELPKIGRIVDVKNLYLAKDGHVNFDGQQGAEVANSLLLMVENDLNELEDTIGDAADPDEVLKTRIERQHEALSTSIDADTHRSVAEEARKLRQDIALIRLSPQNEARVLDREVDSAEKDFEELRDLSSSIDEERHDKLLVTTRRSIRERNYDVARRSINDMRSIRVKVLSESPDFLIAMFKSLAEEDFLAIDEDLHLNYIAEGLEAAKMGQVDQLRAVIGKMFANRVSTGGSASEIVELAHLLGG
ncbi:Hsp70 family protein [Pseudovibrio sp. POLY-S9]|uniref:Hsp70 family protein n=1 Tax=Pseudovibrio sp. POLY-S9 TaxID=1576596 RepID=UPI00070B04F1|nr:Hsp70 family protein [Pseudovibrio sp. POLY-S9]